MRHHLRRTCSAALATVALGSSAVFGSGCSGARAPEAETVQVSSEPVEFAFGVGVEADAGGRSGVDELVLAAVFGSGQE